jgi:transposase
VSVVKALGRPASEAEIAKRIVRVCPTRGIRFSGVSQIRNGDDNRRSLEGILWIVRTGAPWRDLPDVFGNWSTVWKRFRRWALRGVFEKVFEALSGEPDTEYALIDGTIVKVHRHGAGAKGGLKIRPSANRAAARPPKPWRS